MRNVIPKNNFECSTDEFAAYIDGELDPALELALESHLANCADCSADMNDRKQFLCGLNSSLRNEKEIELPANFARLIVANAESSVSGLRRPNERYDAMFICVGMFLFVIFAMGAEAEKMLSGVYASLVQTAAVGGFLGHFLYSIFVGVVVVMRSVASQFRSDVMVGAAIIALFCVTAGMLISRKVLRLRRAYSSTF